MILNTLITVGNLLNFYTALKQNDEVASTTNTNNAPDTADDKLDCVNPHDVPESAVESSRLPEFIKLNDTLATLQFASHFLWDTFCHGKARYQITSWVADMEALVTDSSIVAAFYIELMCRYYSRWTYSILFDCQDGPLKKNFVTIIQLAIISMKIEIYNTIIDFTIEDPIHNILIFSGLHLRGDSRFSLHKIHHSSLVRYYISLLLQHIPYDCQEHVRSNVSLLDVIIFNFFD